MSHVTGVASTVAGSSVPPQGSSALSALKPEAGVSELINLDSFSAPVIPHGMIPVSEVFKASVGQVSVPINGARIPHGFSSEDVRLFVFSSDDQVWVPFREYKLTEDDQLTATLSEPSLIVAAVFSEKAHHRVLLQRTAQDVMSVKHDKMLNFDASEHDWPFKLDSSRVNPSSGVTLIKPPQGHAQGSATLSYPLTLPKGRHNLHPSLELRYDSGVEESQLGIGWSLAVPSIEVEPQWGVPLYSASVETETYLLQGEQLGPVFHRGSQPPREAERVFVARREGTFNRVVRHGDSPSNFWWEVTDKDGLTSSFGGSLADGGLHAASSMRTLDGHVFHWSLREVRDLSGNFVRYHHSASQPATWGGQHSTKLTLDRITYTGSDAKGEGPYAVAFTHSSDVRTTVRTNCKFGICVVADAFVTDIRATYLEKQVGHWTFAYKDGHFGKTLLESITQWDRNDEEFHTHTFDYHDNVHDNELFETAEDVFNTPQEEVTELDYGTLEESGPGADVGAADGGVDMTSVIKDMVVPGLIVASELQVSTSRNIGEHLYVGFNPTLPTKSGSVGFKIGAQQSSGHTLLAVVDLDGDGLLDQVTSFGGGTYYRKNLMTPLHEKLPMGFAPARAVPTLPHISHEKSFMTSFGVEAFPSLGPISAQIMDNWSKRISITETYLLDVNSDGLVDLVYEGSVLFNHIDETGLPTFTLNSADTPVPVGDAEVEAEAAWEDIQAMASSRNESITEVSYDPMLLWTAPFDGLVDVSGVATLQQVEDQLVNNAVHVSIEHVGQGQLASAMVSQGEVASLTGQVAVSKGDRLVFRSSVDSPDMSKSALGAVSWVPVVDYVGRESLLDSNLRNAFHFNAQEDFTLAGRPDAVMTLPKAGEVIVSGKIEKGLLTDVVSLSLLMRDSSTQPWRQALNTEAAAVSFEIPANVEGSLELPEMSVAVEDGTQLRFFAHADTRVDVSQMNWLPVVRYSKLGEQVMRTDHQLPIMPPFDIETYPFTMLSQPLQPWTAPSSQVIAGTVSVTVLGNHYRDDRLTFAVKANGALVYKHSFPLIEGDASGQVNFQVEQGVSYFFEWTHSLGLLEQGAVDLRLFVTAGTDLTVSVPVGHFSSPRPASMAGLLPTAFRGWSRFGYDRTRESVVLSHLTDLCSEAQQQNRTCPASVMFPSVRDQQWKRGEAATLSAHGARSATVGSQALSLHRKGFSGGSMPARVGVDEQNAIGGGVDVAIFGASGSWSKGTSKSILDAIDMNGDGYPDVVHEGSVQYSRPTGGLGVVAGGNGGIRGDRNEASNHGKNGVPAHFAGSGSGKVYNSQSGSSHHAAQSSSNGNCESHSQMSHLGFPSLSVGHDKGTGKATGMYETVDINGDGLPDMLHKGLATSLNMGYQHAATAGMAGTDADIHVSKSASLDIGVGLGSATSDNCYGIAIGLDVSASVHTNPVGLLDVNGDGLPDRVRADGSLGQKLRVGFNTGNGFLPEEQWSDFAGLELKKDLGVDIGLGVYITIAIGPLCLAGCWIIINPGVDLQLSVGVGTGQHADMSGDLLPDFLASPAPGQLHLARNRIRKTHLLKSVHRPLGASFELDYHRMGNTYKQPQQQWVLSSVRFSDGFDQDGPESYTTYSYREGFYDRFERRFYGYRHVSKKEHRFDALSELIPWVAYRTTNSTFINQAGYYSQGLPESVLVSDIIGRKFTEVKYKYTTRPVVALAAGGDAVQHSMFTYRSEEEHRFYEGSLLGEYQSLVQTHEYDDLGNSILTSDLGETADLVDDHHTSVSFDVDPLCHTNWVVGIPTSILQTDASGKVLFRRTGKVDCSNGKFSELTDHAAVTDSAQDAVTSFVYYDNGNLESVTEPANVRGERYTTQYTYEEALDTYVASATDSFGYVTTHAYLPDMGHITMTTDINDNSVVHTFDNWFRTATLASPLEHKVGHVSITFDYHPFDSVPWARASMADLHRNPLNDDPIEVVNFIDGTGRVIQTKKDAALFLSVHGGHRDVMVVDGFRKYDAFGRTVHSRFPLTEPKGTPGTYHTFHVDLGETTKFEYDILDRETKKTNPAGETSHHAFGLMKHQLRQSVGEMTYFHIKETDAHGHHKHQLYNSRRKQVATFEEDILERVWAEYQYDAMDHLTGVIDDHGHGTYMSYDLLGRRVSTQSLDTGLLEKTYDAAGNVVKVVTPNLRAVGKSIDLDYHFTHLVHRNCSLFEDTNVTYLYGAATADNKADNRVGRISKVWDQSGTEERWYDEEGHTIKILKVVLRPPQEYEYVTEWTYDTWSRPLTHKFQDGEQMTYRYDTGGRGFSLHGLHGLQLVEWVRRTYYDKYGNTIYQVLGNDVTTHQYYYARSPDRLKSKLTMNHLGVLQDVTITYDSQGQPVAVRNAAPVNPSSDKGGPVEIDYKYDHRDRLVKAHGLYYDNDQVIYNYTSEYRFTRLHEMLFKGQRSTVERKGKPTVDKEMTYEHLYEYHTDNHPNTPFRVGMRDYDYDGNGNLIQWKAKVGGVRQTYVWDENNYLREVARGGHSVYSTYDHEGRRVMRRGISGVTVWVDPYFEVDNAALMTKHYVFNGVRIATHALTNHTSPVSKITKSYYYHLDHHNNAHYLTDADTGVLFQHYEHFPFGEMWVGDRSSIKNVPYIFEGKEMDQTSELYYFGKRYYDPRTQLWQSPDPAYDGFLDGKHNGGVYNQKNMAQYSFEYNNPICNTDPDGAMSRSATLRAVDQGHLKPDIDSRLGAYYSTRGYKSGTVGYSVHKSIGAIYMGMGSVGEEKIGKVFKSQAAKKLYAKSVHGPASLQMAKIEYGYWRKTLKNNNGMSIGGLMGSAVPPTARDWIQKSMPAMVHAKHVTEQKSRQLYHTIKVQSKRAFRATRDAILHIL